MISFNGKGVKKKKEEESGYFVDMDFSSCGMKATGVLGSRGALYLWRLSSSTRSMFLDSRFKEKTERLRKPAKLMVLAWVELSGTHLPCRPGSGRHRHPLLQSKRPCQNHRRQQKTGGDFWQGTQWGVRITQ